MKLIEGFVPMTDDDYVALARDNPTWQEIAASWALEGIIMTRNEEIIAGRMIAGELTLNEAQAEIRKKAQVVADPTQMALAETLH